MAAGLLSISFSLAALFTPASNKAELVAVVQDGKTEKAVSDAMVEVLTTGDAVSTSLKPDWSGKARFDLALVLVFVRNSLILVAELLG